MISTARKAPVAGTLFSAASSRLGHLGKTPARGGGGGATLCLQLERGSSECGRWMAAGVERGRCVDQ